MPDRVAVTSSPRIVLAESPSGSPEEAAAAIAAIERFLRDHASPAPDDDTTSGWVLAARLEAVDRTPGGDLVDEPVVPPLT